MTKVGESYQDGMLDVTGAEHVEVRVSADRTVLWVSTEEGTKLRICRIKRIEFKSAYSE